MNSRTRIFGLAVLFCAVGGALITFALFGRKPPREPDQPVSVENSHLEAPAKAAESPLKEFSLLDQQGKVFQSQSLEGHVWVGSIFYADCPSVCRTLNQRVSELQREFADRDVHFVSITCDPSHDTPKRLADYSRLFGADADRWHFLTGDLDLIKRVGNDILGIVVDELVHSDRMVIFDRNGIAVGTYSTQDRNEFLKAQKKIEELLTGDGTS